MPYKVTNFQYFMEEMSALDVDLSLPWTAYQCLDWKRGAAGPIGFKYGVMRLPGCKENDPKIKAHRRAYEIFKGPIPDGYDVCHHCDRAICFHPAHLFASDAKGNMEDMVSKGRCPDRRGELNQFSQLTNEQIIEIRSLCKPRKGKLWIAEKFGISVTHVYRIYNGACWKHI